MNEKRRRKGVGRHRSSDTMNHVEVLKVSEKEDVFTRRIIPVGADRVKVSAAVESSASRCAGVVELWHGASQILWHHQRRGAAGAVVGAVGRNGAAPLTRMVLRCGR